MTVVKAIRHGAAILAVLMLSACGGDASLGDGSGSSLGGSGGSGSSDYKLGNSASGSFSNGTIAVSNATLAAGGSTAMSVDIVDKEGVLAPGTDATIIFSSNCLASGTATIAPEAPSLASGRANVTYTAAGCSGSDVVTAIVTVAGVTLTAKGTVTIQPAELGGLEFISATPSVIGMAGSPIPSQSVVVFVLKDGTGSPLPNRTVDFSLSTEVGGAKLVSSSAVSDSSGNVRAVVQAGSVHTVVRVKAQSTDSSSGQTISSQSEELVITTGLPDQDSFSLAAVDASINGSCQGASTQIVVRAADRYNNPVPAGTAISFTTEGGKINGQCTTGDPNADPLTEAGVCTVLLTVQSPIPSDGKVTVLATAIGEESFTDVNGNGYWDDAYIDSNGVSHPKESFDDLPEAFVDYDGDNVHDGNEPFVDFNNNGTYDGPNGTFNGYVCQSAGQNCSSTTVNVRKSVVVAFGKADTRPTVSGFGDATLNVGDIHPYEISVADSSGRSLPSGTTYSLSTTAGTVLDPSSVGPFHTVDGDDFEFVLAGDSAGQGTATLKITVPADGCGEGDYVYTVTKAVKVNAPPSSP